jgi:Ribonuclease G/E
VGGQQQPPFGSIARLLDAAVGETREALVQDGRVVALNIVRASEQGVRARWGELYAGRVQRIDRRLRGAFIDLGLNDDSGFLPLDAQGEARRRDGARAALREGEAIVVSLSREAARAKGAVLELASEPHPGGAPRRLAQHECDVELAQARPADTQTRERIDAAIEEALARRAPIPGGGVVSIEPTSALVAIDVDAAARPGVNDPERFALDLNIAAAREIARQARLRNLGGILAIDFVSMRAQANRKRLEAEAKAAFAGDPWGVQVGPLSRFGVMELARAQLRAPLHERLCDPDGRPSIETVALAALRAIEREAAAARGREIAVALAPEVSAWLESAAIPWRTELADRIGARWKIEVLPNTPRDRIDVRAL